MADEEKKKLSPLTVLAGAGASVTSMLLGSLFGDSGTLAGAALSSVICSAGTFWYEHGARRAHARLRARRDLEASAVSRQLTAAQTQVFLRTREDAHYRRQRMSRLRVTGIVTGMLAACLASAVLTLTVIEAATGQTLSSDLQGRAQYGTTVGGYTTRSPSVSPPEPSPSPSYQSSAISPPASPSVPPSPSAASSSAVISPSASVSSPGSPSPSVTPDPSPDGSP